MTADSTNTSDTTSTDIAGDTHPLSMAATGSAVHPYENAVKWIATVQSVEDFWSVYDHMVRPSKISHNVTTTFHFFREGIKPTWEDPMNVRGGQWTVRLRKGLASRYWEELLLALIGSQFTSVPDGEVCGVVISVRYTEDILSIWNKNASDHEIVDRIRDTVKRILQFPNFVHMEYKPHETSLHGDKTTNLPSTSSSMTHTSTGSTQSSNVNATHRSERSSHHASIKAATGTSSGTGDRGDDLRAPSTFAKPSSTNKRDLERSWR